MCPSSGDLQNESMKLPYLVGFDGSLQILDPFVPLGSGAARETLGAGRRRHLKGTDSELNHIQSICFASCIIFL